MSYKKYTFILVVFVFLVVLAGGIVRTTQSGMGCPDWPKCFGMWIPPLNEKQLPPDFEKYLSKQDIDHTFNVYHTWIEYINRLLGAVLGLLILIHFAWSVRIRKQLNMRILLLSFLMVILVGFTGWLGKVVVDNNLAVFKITMHMLSALALAVLPLLILRYLNFFDIRMGQYSHRYLMIFSFILLIQLYLGTVVREEIDIVSKQLAYQGRETWIQRIGNDFIIHRSFSWVILLGSIYLYWKSGYAKFEGLVLTMVVSLFVMGVLFVYLDFPAVVQPIHLLISLVLISLTFTYSIPIKINENSVDSSKR